MDMLISYIEPSYTSRYKEERVHPRKARALTWPNVGRRHRLPKYRYVPSSGRTKHCDHAFVCSYTASAGKATNGVHYFVLLNYDIQVEMWVESKGISTFRSYRYSSKTVGTEFFVCRFQTVLLFISTNVTSGIYYAVETLHFGACITRAKQ